MIPNTNTNEQCDLQLPWLVRKNYFHLTERETFHMTEQETETERSSVAHTAESGTGYAGSCSPIHTLDQILSLQNPTFSTNHSSRNTELKNNIILKDILELLSGQNKNLPAPTICIIAYYCLSDFQENTYYVGICKQPVSPSSAAVISHADGAAQSH